MMRKRTMEGDIAVEMQQNGQPQIKRSCNSSAALFANQSVFSSNGGGQSAFSSNGGGQSAFSSNGGGQSAFSSSKGIPCTAAGGPERMFRHSQSMSAFHTGSSPIDVGDQTTAMRAENMYEASCELAYGPRATPTPNVSSNDLIATSSSSSSAVLANRQGAINPDMRARFDSGISSSRSSVMMEEEDMDMGEAIDMMSEGAMQEGMSTPPFQQYVSSSQPCVSTMLSSMVSHVVSASPANHRQMEHDYRCMLPWANDYY